MPEYCDQPDPTDTGKRCDLELPCALHPSSERSGNIISNPRQVALSTEELDELERIERAMTAKGEWTVDRYDDYRVIDRHGGVATGASPANTRGIAAMRNAFPALIAQARRGVLLERLVRIEAEHQRCCPEEGEGACCLLASRLPLIFCDIARNVTDDERAALDATSSATTGDPAAYEQIDLSTLGLSKSVAIRACSACGDSLDADEPDRSCEEAPSGE